MAKIKIDNELYEEIKRFSEKTGYSSVDEFIVHLLEKIVRQTGPDELDEDLAKRLRGLGYIS